MGRASGDCSERIPDAVRQAPRISSERLLDLPAVDALLEPQADLLARREKIVVALSAWGEVNDPHALIAVAMTAGVGRRLVERLEAISTTPRP